MKTKLLANSQKFWSINEMGRTGGEPDVISLAEDAEAYLLIDCCKESPSGRRSLCYDREGLESRKQ